MKEPLINGSTLETRVEYAAKRKAEMNCCQAAKPGTPPQPEFGILYRNKKGKHNMSIKILPVRFTENGFMKQPFALGISPERSEHCGAMSLEGCEGAEAETDEIKPFNPTVAKFSRA